MTDVRDEELPYMDDPILDDHDLFDAPERHALAKPKKCRRHEWTSEWDPEGECAIPLIEVCDRCGKRKDPARSRRGRLSAARGKRIQRERIERLGGQNLAGNNPNLDGIGLMFRYESKSGGAFSERYWRWLDGIPAGSSIPVLIVTETPGPGRRARSFVVVKYDDWESLHREEGAA